MRRGLPLAGYPGGEPLAQPMRNLGPRAISVGTFSKPFGLPGLRIGWLAATEEIVKAAGVRATTSPWRPGESGLSGQRGPTEREKIVARNQAIVRQNLDYAEAGPRNTANWRAGSAPRGGLLALLKYKVDLPSDRVANTLAQDCTRSCWRRVRRSDSRGTCVSDRSDPAIFAEGLESEPHNVSSG